MLLNFRVWMTEKGYILLPVQKHIRHTTLSLLTVRSTFETTKHKVHRTAALSQNILLLRRGHCYVQYRYYIGIERDLVWCECMPDQLTRGGEILYFYYGTSIINLPYSFRWSLCTSVRPKFIIKNCCSNYKISWTGVERRKWYFNEKYLQWILHYIFYPSVYLITALEIRTVSIINNHSVQ